MTKTILGFLIFVSSISFSQHKIKGILVPKVKTDWVILYKIEGTKQVFVSNTSLKNDSLKIGNKKEAVSIFEITLPSNAKSGAYRATYALEGAGSVDFFFHKEDVTFRLNPQYPDETITFLKSEENKLYKEYLTKISEAQEKLDSIQISAFQNQSINNKEAYKKALAKVLKTQQKYEELAKNKYIFPLVKATLRNNIPEIETSPDAYMEAMKTSYFDKIDFSNETLKNSSFITDRVADFVFYLSFSDDEKTQQNLYKEAIKKVLGKIKSQNYQKDIIEFLITQFEATKNLEIIDYLFENQYNKLPENLQDATFKKEKLALFATEIGRIAPDFSWTEKGKKMQLATLNEASQYVLVFWSTSCSHCLREIPQLHTFMKDKKNIKVIAFALEKEASVWESFSKTNLFGFHNVLGLKKWENEVARTYQIVATPTYFILDKNKKIIAKPDEIDDVKAFFNKK
ncbi:TlpA family protein disulfide reductase [Polaribacter sp.]|uniref:TlpA family protein disulfide reductase n=2 Tax=Polaribacter sp. TaxID=1920175 RepID=UPI004048D3EE